MLPGYATPEGTAQYARRYSSMNFRRMPHTQLCSSQAGFGCYRIDPQQHNHHAALTLALNSGINLIDTSTNYSDGGSERLVGHIIALQKAAGQIERENIIVVSKVGYLQGRNYAESQQRKAQGNPWPEVVEYQPGLEHCIHPSFIEAQLTESLERLQLETLDCYLLHNPEYYLAWASGRDAPLEPIRQVYYDRIRRAFEHLEKEVAAGRIRYYGISSNTFVAAADDPQFTELTRIWEIAQSLGEDHHFRVIQLPFNLIETEAATQPNQPDGQTVLQFAADHDLAVLVNRPLNAIEGNKLIRLADAPESRPTSTEAVEDLLARLVALEQQFQNEIMSELSHSPQIVSQLGQYLTAGQTLSGRWFTLGSYAQWQQTLTSLLLPRLNAARDFMTRPGNMPLEAIAWVTEYFGTVNRAFSAIGGLYAQIAREQEQQLRQRIESVEPSWLGATLSQTAIHALRTTHGVTSVLVGMRTQDYVRDVVAELERPAKQKIQDDAWDELTRLNG